MPDADALLMAAQQGQRLTADLQALEATKLELSKHANTAGRLYRLKTNDDFAWFLKEFLEPLISEEDRILNDRATSTTARDIACHRKDIAKAILGLAEAKYTEFLAKSNPKEPKPL